MQSSDDKKKYCDYLKVKTKELYKNIDYVYCPILDEKVYFNFVGFRHLLYKSSGKPRLVNEIIYKLKLFPLVVSVIKKSSKILNKRQIIIQYSKNKKLKESVLAYAVVSCVGKRKIYIRVIILKMISGKHIFYSVMKDKK